ncbi:MAG: nuclear transport factor 2 family protein [Actinomycetota bacterium]
MSSASTMTADDRLDILDLYARQSHAIDGGDSLGWARTFAANGRFESPTFRLTATGYEQLEQFAKSSNDAALARGEHLRHWIDAVVMTRVDELNAHAEAYLMIIATSIEGSRIDRSVRVIDDLVKTNGEWLLASRTVVRDV